MHASSARPVLDSGIPAAGVSPLTPSRRRMAVRLGTSMPDKVVDDMRERLAAVVATTGELERNRSQLMERMLTTVKQMEALRDRLAQNPDGQDEALVSSLAIRLARKYQLTPRELEVAILLSGGAPNAVIASSLRISEHTARHHTRHILVKLRLHSRARAGALIARELGGAALLP